MVSESDKKVPVVTKELKEAYQVLEDLKYKSPWYRPTYEDHLCAWLR